VASEIRADNGSDLGQVERILFLVVHTSVPLEMPVVDGLVDQNSKKQNLKVSRSGDT
jgi:hypothetical protein